MRAMAERLEWASGNVERTRMRGIAQHLAGWEHLTMREAAAMLRAIADEKDKP